MNCPARMNSDITFRDYRPNCGSEHMIQLQNNLTNSYDYRLFLQENAEEIMNFQRASIMKKNLCKPCTAPQVMWSQMTPLRPQTPYDAPRPEDMPRRVTPQTVWK